MEHTKLKIFLQKVGLTPKEIQAYLYCLSHGPQLVTGLAKVTGTTRTNTYDVIKKLETKGLCHSTGTSYGKKIQATDPKQLKALLENKIDEAKELSKEFETILPFLQMNTSLPYSPFTRVSYFEGTDNVKKMLWQSLQSKEKTILIAGSELDMVSALGKEFVSDFHKKRKEKSIMLRTIRPDSKRVDGDEFTKDVFYLREIRIRPKGKVRLKSNIILWDNYIALYSLKDSIIFGTLIESDDMSVMMRSWFDVIWEHSKKI